MEPNSCPRPESTDLGLLASRVRRGDTAAAALLLRALLPQVRRMVGRAIRSPGGNSPFARRVTAEVISALADNAPPAGEALVAAVTERVCRAAVERLRSGADSAAGAFETVVG